MNHQIDFENSLINFLSLSSVLDKDLESLLNNDDGSDSWKRNFIRASIAMVEGYCHCFREFSQVAINTGSELSKKRIKVILDEKSCSASGRIKLTIQAAYEVFEIDQTPDFGSEEWRNAESAIEKRSYLMHPKSAQELEISDANWEKYFDGIKWLILAASSLIDEANKKSV